MFTDSLALTASLTLILVSFVQAWDCGASNGVLEALAASGFDQFANATASLNGTSGQYILTELSQGNKAIFAPTDSAFSGMDSSILHNQTALTDLIAYHIVSGNYINQTETYPNLTIGRTLLNDSELVMLEGNQSQVLPWSKLDNGSLFVMNQGSNISILNTSVYDNTTILATDSVLTPPPNISTVLNNGSYDLTSVATFLKSASVPNGPSLLNELSSARGVTVFAPNNAGVQAAQSSLSGIGNNSTALLNLFSNHIINGTSVYSTEISNGTNYVSAGGEPLAFIVNSTGNFVSSGGSNQARIVEPNVLTSNGVVHIINDVMFDTKSDSAAASSAYASATSVAALAAQTTQTGPVTATATPISTPDSTPAASTSFDAASSTLTSSDTATSASQTSETTTSETTTSASTPTSTPTSGAVDNNKNWKQGMLVGLIVGALLG